MKMKTIDLKGKDYAQVAERIKQFREDCPNGLIETIPTINGDTIMFEARILKDKAKQTSAEGTGHSYGKLTGDKSFEKHETISVGRALAMLGYMASGEVASFDEMSDFLEYQGEKVEKAILDMNQAGTLDELKTIFMSLGTLMKDVKIIDAKNKRKEVLCKLSKSNNVQTNGTNIEKEKSQEQSLEISTPSVAVEK